MWNRKYFLASVMGLIVSAANLMGSSHYINYDYIIVGNGTAGAVLARKLSDDHSKTVLVLEAGINQNDDPEVLDVQGANLFSDLTDMTYDPKYAKTYSVAVFFPLQATVYSEGRGWGGSSKHNYLQVIRGTPSIYDGWAAASGNAQWSYNNLLPVMKALENYTPCQTTANLSQRGVGGPISMTQSAPITTDPLALLLVAGLQGAPFIADINDYTSGTLGFSSFQLFATTGPSGPCSLGHRSFSTNSFLTPSVVSNDGKGKHGRLLRIESNASVSRVMFKKNKAIGVEFIYGSDANKVLKAYGKTIILCAGAVNSPAILQRSGIGDAGLLNSLGINVLVDNPNVGAHLMNQYGVNAIALGTTNAQPFLQGIINASGGPPGFVYPNDTTRRVQLAAFQAGPGVVQIIGFILEPKSRGSLQIVSTNPLVSPNINLNMYSDGLVTQAGTDANLAVTTYYLLQTALGAGNILYPSLGQYLGGPQALLLAAENPAGITVASHIAGTTQMATSIGNGGVVDGNLWVFGVKNLMIADLGVAPVMPDGNTCYAAYLIGLQAAGILGRPTPPAL